MIGDQIPHCLFCEAEARFLLYAYGTPEAGFAPYCLRHLAIKGEQIRRVIRRGKRSTGKGEDDLQELEMEP